MRLKIKIQDNLVEQELFKKKNIPCVCQIKGEGFELVFQDPLPPLAGNVEGWVRNEIDSRVPAGAGGKYSHYCFGMVTLKSVDEHVFDIVDLSFFDHDFGWIHVLEEGKLCEPGIWSSQHEMNEIEAMFPPVKQNKKRKKLMDALTEIEKEEP